MVDLTKRDRRSKDIAEIKVGDVFKYYQNLYMLVENSERIKSVVRLTGEAVGAQYSIDGFYSCNLYLVEDAAIGGRVTD